jgi:YD repeat-containing protein
LLILDTDRAVCCPTAREHAFAQIDQSGDVTDPFGNVTHNAYDTDGNLTSTTTQYGTANAETTYYTYTDGTGGLPKGLLLTSYQDRASGNVTLSSDTYYPDTAPTGSQDQIETSTDVNGVTHTYTYDSIGDQITDKENWTNPSDSSDVEVIENDSTYDADGRVTSTLTGKVTEESTGAIIKPGTTTTTDYNAQGQVSSTTDQYGNTTQNEYDISGNLIETVNPNGTVVRTVYDAMGRPIWVTDAFNPANGNPSGTETIYDSLGQAVETERFPNVDIQVTADPTYSGAYDQSFTPPTGSPVSTTMTSYTPQGQVATQVGTDGQTTAYTYYPNGQQETVTTAAGSDEAATTTYVYHTAPTSGDDGDYQLVTDPRGYTTRTDYDAQGRTIKTTYDVNADGSIPSGAISTSTSYSPYGQTVTNTDEMGRVTVDKYDNAGNLIEVDQPQVLDPTTGEMTTPVTTYGYDDYGDEISQTDANDHVTHFTYDALGEQIGRTLPDGETENTTYDDFGRVLTSTDFKGQTTAYTYDDSATGDGRETGEYFFAAGVSALDSGGDVQTSLAEDSTVYTYDNLGRTATITDSTGVTTDSYDTDGNLRHAKGDTRRGRHAKGDTRTY